MVVECIMIVIINIATLTCAILTAPSLPKGLPSGILLDVLWDREKGERYF